MSRFTTLFERLAVDVLTECDVQGAAGVLRISWDEAWQLMDHAVERGRADKTPTAPAPLGVAGQASRSRHGFLTLVSNLLPGTVAYLSAGRPQASLDGYF